MLQRKGNRERKKKYDEWRKRNFSAVREKRKEGGKKKPNGTIAQKQVQKEKMGQYSTITEINTWSCIHNKFITKNQPSFTRKLFEEAEKCVSNSNLGHGFLLLRLLQQNRRERNGKMLDRNGTPVGANIFISEAMHMRIINKSSHRKRIPMNKKIIRMRHGNSRKIT